MANEKIVNRENLKAFRQAFQEKLENGQIVPKLAKNLQNVSTESGSVQETPFIYQGTGTANGTLTVDTSDWGKHLEKQGNTVCVNQRMNKSVYPSSQTINDVAFTNNNDGSFTVNGLANGSATLEIQTFYNTDFVFGHKYLIVSGLNQTGSASTFEFMILRFYPTETSSSNANIYNYAQIFTFGYTDTGEVLARLVVRDGTNVSNLRFKPQIVDLTQWFNGDIPQDLLDHPENASRYGITSDLAHNTGTLVNSNGQYLVCGGRQLFQGNSTENPQYIGHYYIANNFVKESNDNFNCFRIKVIANTDYCLARYNANLGTIGLVRFVDKNFALISGNDSGYSLQRTTFKTPSNCEYIEFSVGTSSTAQVTLTLYYATGEGYDQYYPYVAPKVYDTGSEVLRKAGSVKDYKEPNGTIHRLVGTDNPFYNSGWNYNSGGDYFYLDSAYYSRILSKIKCPSTNDEKANILVLGYDIVPVNGFGTLDKSIAIGNNGVVYYKNTSITAHEYNGCKSTIDALTNILYALATPTTEQGTQFPENIEINDYGTMGWYSSYTDYSTNTPVVVPQGCKIFYPADISLFVDSLGQRDDIDWDAISIVSSQQLNNVDTKHDNLYAIMQENIGGALRQLLASEKSLGFISGTAYIDLGDLNFSYSNAGFFFAAKPNNMKALDNNNNKPNFLSPKYKVIEGYIAASMGSANDLSITLNTNGNIYIKDTSLDGDVNKLKGILLAYEKAS